MSLVNLMTEWFDRLQQILFEEAVQPLLYHLGAASWLSDAFEGTGWLLLGCGQILVMLLLIRPLQLWRPAEPVNTDPQAKRERRSAVRVDVIYTLIHRLGLIRVGLFIAVAPAWDALFGWLAVHGVDGWHLDQWIAPWWPGVTDTALAGFLAYLLVFDLLMYGVHRGQHQVNAWWALHALHHSQRHMTMWTDSRNHLLDDLIVDILFVLVARVIGVPPGQFMGLVALSQLVENLSHANVRLDFGRWGRYLLVSPVFHRLHHAVGTGHESSGKGTLGGHNFAVLFPIWDVMFGTASFNNQAVVTGIRDQLPDEGGRDYGEGFWRQQWLGLLRLWGRA